MNILIANCHTGNRGDEAANRALIDELNRRYGTSDADELEKIIQQRFTDGDNSGTATNILEQLDKPISASEVKTADKSSKESKDSDFKEGVKNQSAYDKWKESNSKSSKNEEPKKEETKKDE